MLVMYLFVRVIDVGRVFVCEGYICWSCLCLLRVSMLVMYLCVRGIEVAHVFCVRGIDVCDVCVC